MKRGLLFISALTILGGVAFWAYRVDYTLQRKESRVAALHRQIAQERDALAVLRAERDYLNAPGLNGDRR
jgi:hypothetical protein